MQHRRAVVPLRCGMQQKFLTPEEALQKLKQYCAYQERSHHEAAQKLWDLGVRRAEHDAILASLIEEDYLNEERFAIQFAGGKFRMKGWGKKKIYYALKEKQVSSYCINKALQQLDDEAYLKTAETLAARKYESLRGEQYLVRKKKTSNYLIQKGYEFDIVSTLVQRLAEKP